jgi:nicotinamidase-related amidase
MTPLNLDPKTTALVLIDLQRGVAALQGAPYSTAEVIKKCATLASAFRAGGSTVVYVRVDVSNMLTPPVDAPFRDPKSPPPPASVSELLPEAGMQPGDLFITKRHWGAFCGTDLEKQLNDRGIRTIVLGGIATNFGVESTARGAVERGFELVLVEDAMTTMNADWHQFAVKNIFPKLGRVRTADQFL